MFSAIVFLVITATVTAVPAGPALPPCEQPVVLGRCDAIKHRFAFFADTNECRQFTYSGCGGNANNFASLADCQAACPTAVPVVKRETDAAMPTETPAMVTDVPAMVTDVPAMVTDTSAMVTEKAAEITEKPAVTTPKPEEATTMQSDAIRVEDQNPAASETMKCTSDNCSDNAYVSSYYKELNCTPVADPANPGCVASYDCSKRTTLKEEKCYHQGNEYAVGENIPEDKTPTCMVHCKCEQLEKEKSPKISCINIECGELWQPQPEPGCARQFKKGQCCSTGTYCEPKEGAETQVAPVKVAHCDFEGKTYVEGQKFFSEQYPCATCICQEGFKGIIEEPFCSQASCHLELFYSGYLRRGCVPVFYVDTCCPIEWRCPEECNMPSEMPTTNDANTATTNQTEVSVKPEQKDATPSETAADGTKMECTPEPLTKCEFGGVEYALGEKLPADVSGECVVCTCSVPPTPTCIKNEDTCVRVSSKTAGN